MPTPHEPRSPGGGALTESAADGADARSAPDPMGAADTATVVAAVTSLFGGEPFAISDLGAVGHPVVHASAALAELTGFAEGDFVGRNLGFLLRNDTDQEGERLFRAATAAAKHVTTVMRTYLSDGSLIWTEQRHYPIHAGGGVPRHLLTLFRDVTAEVHAEGTQAMQLELSSSLEGDGRFFSYALLLHDDGRAEVAWASDAWQQLTGYTLDDLKTRGLKRFVHPEDRDQLLERFQGLREQERRTDQLRLVTQQGKVMWVEDFAARSWRSNEAGITAVYGMMRDVTSARRDTANLWRLAHVDPLTCLPNAHLLEYRIQQAQLQARRGDLAAAAALLERALVVCSQCAAPWTALGVVQRRQGRFAEAEQSYRKALAADPGYADAAFNLGVLYELYLQRPELALAEYRHFRTLAADDTPAVEQWIGDLQRRVKPVERAVRLEEAGS